MNAQIIEALLKTLADSKPYIHWQLCQMVVDALEKIGGDLPQVIEALLKTLVDPASDSFIQSSAVSTLAKVGSEQPQVIEAFLKALTNSSFDVREKVADSLASLPIDSLTTGILLEKILLEYEPITSKQFSADSFVDTLLSALQKVIGEV